MNLIIWLIFGGVIGLLAGILVETNGRQGTFVNVITGAAGATLGGLVVSPLVGMATSSQDAFSMPALFVSFFGAATLLAIVDFIRPSSVR